MAFSLYVGLKAGANFSVSWEPPAPYYNLVNWEVELIVYPNLTNLTPLLTFGTTPYSGVNIISSTEVAISITPQDIQSLATGTYFYKMNFINPAGTSTTVLSGNFVVTPSQSSVISSSPPNSTAGLTGIAVLQGASVESISSPSVSLTGGNIDNIDIGNTTPATAVFTDLTYTTQHGTVALVTPTEGEIINIPANLDSLIIEGSSTLNTITLQLPSGVTNGRKLFIMSDIEVDELKVLAGSGDNLKFTPSYLSANCAFNLAYYQNYWRVYSTSDNAFVQGIYGLTPSTTQNTTLPDGFDTIAIGSPISSITVDTGGTNYTSTPTVTIGAPQFGTQATATATLSYGVASTNITSGGAGYTTATVAFSAPPIGTTATGTAVISGGVITGITITNAGSGYLSAPTVTITGTNTSPATASAVLATSGVVQSISLINAGSGYQIPPTVTITGGSATTNATATAILSLSSVALTMPPKPYNKQQIFLVINVPIASFTISPNSNQTIQGTLPSSVSTFLTIRFIYVYGIWFVY